MSRRRNRKKALPEKPASNEQRKLLRLASQKKWLQPNPFASNHPKWENLTSKEADKILATLSPERRNALEKELAKQQKELQDKGLGRSVGRTLEGAISQIGHSIDGGIS